MSTLEEREEYGGLKKSKHFFGFRSPKKVLDDTPVRVVKNSVFEENDSHNESSFENTPNTRITPIRKLINRFKRSRSSSKKKVNDENSDDKVIENNSEKVLENEMEINISNVTIRNSENSINDTNQLKDVVEHLNTTIIPINGNSSLPTYVNLSVALNGYPSMSLQKDDKSQDNKEENISVQNDIENNITNIRIHSVPESPKMADKFTITWATVAEETPEAYQDMVEANIAAIEGAQALARNLLEKEKDKLCEDALVTLLEINGHGENMVKNIKKHMFKYISNCKAGVVGYGEETHPEDLAGYWFGIIQTQLDIYSKLLVKGDAYIENGFKEIVVKVEQKEKPVKKVPKKKQPTNESAPKVVETERMRKQKEDREAKFKAFQEMKKKMKNKNSEAVEEPLVMIM
uniref:DUF4806 domain-containing protein n=1 Tax=Parastrongyloides trichosuri TaxID=131310 RepID=A0A0N4Z253_PARTI